MFILFFGLALSGCLGAQGDNGLDENGGGEEPEPDGSSTDDGGEDNGEGSMSGPGADGNETKDPDDKEENGDDGDQNDEENDENGTTYYDPGWPELSQADIRPGVRIHMGGGQCTSNFIFSSLDNQTLYIGLASHCVGGMDLDSTVSIAGISGAGVVEYCSWMHTENEDHCPSGDGFILNNNDFALIRIKDEHREKVHPALLHWGGPTSLGPPAGSMTHVLAYGNSGLNPAGPLSPMEGFVLPIGPGGDSASYMSFVRPGVQGDSGSAVIRTDGQALGILVGIATVPPGANLVTNLEPSLEYMTQKTGIQVELKTWELLNAPLPL